jgi:hypothetical protein
MTVPQTLAEVLREHVTLELECIDRMYLNAYIPRLQHELGVVGFLRQHRGHPIASSVLLQPISDAFLQGIEQFAYQQGIPVVTFAKGQRKDDLAREHLARFVGEEGILFIGKAQERASVTRTQKRRHPDTGQSYPWLVKATAMVNHYYFYGVDADFGPFFLKFGSYFPYNAKLCFNGHEWLKRQLAQEGIAFEALDNGIRACADPARLQELARELTPHLIERFFHKWLAKLPHPFTRADQEAGYVYQLSILQAEFSLTQVLDRPVAGRIFFEEAIRENLDLGRPDQVQLIFSRRVTKRTPGVFRTRVITEGVTPSLHVDYQSSRIKQYHKEGRALRTETTVNNPRDFGVGKRLGNLPVLREVGFAANRRLLSVETTSHACLLNEDALQATQRPAVRGEQRGSALRLTDPSLQALLSVLLLFRFLAEGFASRDLREPFAALLGVAPSTLTLGRMSYQLRRLRLHSLIERIPKTHRYRLTPLGLRTALFFTRSYGRLLRPGYAETVAAAEPGERSVARAFSRLSQAMDACCIAVHLKAAA